MDVTEFKMEYIQAGDLLLDHSYQRPFRASNARRLAEAWDWSQFAPLVGSRRNGHVYVTEGQHRLGALKMMGYEGLIPVMTRKGITVQQEAKQFLAQDARLSISRVDKHPALLIALDPTALGVQAVLDVVHVTVSTSAGPERCAAPNELYRVYREYGPDVLQQTLLTIRKVWGEEHFGMAQVRALGRVLGGSSVALDTGRLVRMLERHDMGWWMLRADESQAGKTPNRGDSLWRAITKQYNRGLGLNKRI